MLKSDSDMESGGGGVEIGIVRDERACKGRFAAS